MNSYEGGCSCKNIVISLFLDSELSQYTPRACQCSYCKKKNAAYISFPDWKLEVKIKNSVHINKFRFSTRTADFVSCKICDELIYVVSKIGNKNYSVVNITAFKNVQFPDPVKTDFDSELQSERIIRRKSNWISDVDVEQV